MAPAKHNFECMLCDYKAKVKTKGYHLGICKNCVRRIKVDWPERKDIIVTSDNKAVK
jgi:hypothetical protein